MSLGIQEKLTVKEWTVERVQLQSHSTKSHPLLPVIYQMNSCPVKYRHLGLQMEPIKTNSLREKKKQRQKEEE
jgi:hypothetical protein